MRERVAAAKRVVVKVGTRALTDTDGKLEVAKVTRLVHELCELLPRELVCVTSGAIAAGLSPLGLARRPKDMPTLQAAAAVGQSHLMDAYQTAFEARGRVCGQVLLTRADFVDRQRYVNALNTFQRLLALGAVPVVNENDSVGTDEIRFGENDLLAALVANLVRADAFILLSDVDGLHEGGPGGPLVDVVEGITPEIEALASGTTDALSSGGMRTKLDAARIATASGIPVVIARAEPGMLGRLLAGERLGTVFTAGASRLTSRKAWIGYATVPRGRVVVDEGAREALTAGGRSLLAAGVEAVEGVFGAGDAVEVADGDGPAFARGLVRFSSEELEHVAGWDSKRISEAFGAPRVVVHRDELVVL